MDGCRLSALAHPGSGRGGVHASRGGPGRLRRVRLGGADRFPDAGAGLGRGPGIPYFGELQRDQRPPLLPGAGWHPRGSFPEPGCIAAGGGAGGPGGRDSLRVVANAFLGATAGGAGRGSSGSAPRGAVGCQPGMPCSRFRGRRARSDFAVAPESSTPKPPIRCRSTSRPGSVCTPVSGAGPCTSPTRTVPWPLYRAQLTRLEDQLVAAAGISVAGPPESVLFSPGVRTQFGRPRGLGSTDV